MAVTTPQVNVSPENWRDTLLAGLAARMPQLRRCDDYYIGKHRMAFTTAQFRETFGSLFSAFADNWCDLVVDASAERLRVEGFRFGPDSDADDDAWEIWQRNKLDAEANMAHTDAIKLGCTYALIGADDGGKATIQVEPADQAIVYVDPAMGRHRLAGLRMWTDEWGVGHCVLYTPSEIVWWRRESENAEWQPEEVGSGGNPLGVVPLVPLVNAPSLSNRLGRSDIERVMPLQDAVNKLCGDMIVASEFAAYPQRWATGIELPTNPETGDKMAPNFLGGADRVWGVEEENAKFGNFMVSDLGIYVRAIEMAIQHIAAQTRTPPHYLLGSTGTFPSGESLKATETGLVAKVRNKMLSFGEGWEETMRLAFAVEGDQSRAEMTAVETIWANPESRIVAETVDAATKLASIGVPRPALWEYVGASPQQIERWKVEGEPTPTPALRETVSVAATPEQGVEIAQGMTPTGAPPATTSNPPGGTSGR
jgi:Phage portal protein, SPP1 Gp6-like